MALPVPSRRWYGQQLGWPRRGPTVAPERSLHGLSMLYDADCRRGSRFPEAKAPDRSSCPDAIAIWYGSHCGRCSRCRGRVGQSHRHDQEGGVSIVVKAGPRRGRQDPSHQDCCSRSATRRAPEYGHPRRRVVCTPCAPPNALRIRPAKARASGAHVSRSDVPSYEGLSPCPRHRIATCQVRV
jgi:hypothetical protein